VPARGKTVYDTGDIAIAERSRGVREPIAIIGMGGRFPGAPDVDAFWTLLAEGRDAIVDYPGGRDPYIDEVYTPGSSLAGRVATRQGGFLPNVDQFDAEFFGISPREAALLDPQHRLLLEVAWEAIDDAGLRRDQVAGKGTGVFVGLWTSDYEACFNDVSGDVNLYATTGTGRYSASGRLAYFLDARGPTLTMDTACSSSLVTLHFACESLWNDESGIALAGGVNLMLRPEITMAYSRAKMLSPDGRCKFGDATANGYVRSEGAGIVVLKRLSRAVADGDPIYAMVRGSAVNNDGRGSGSLVAPSSSGQEEVFQAALQRAGVSPTDLDYVEAHGTGTLRGDPVEIEAIGRVLKSAPRTHPCLVGSVKTNFGHTEAASGVAGIIKVALSLQHRTVPATLHLHEPNPNIPWADYPITMATESVAWPTSDHAPLAGVCSFGITGTNAHAILEGAPLLPERGETEASTGRRPALFLLSGHTPEALTAMATSWQQRLQHDAQWPPSLKDLAYTAAVRRTRHEFRLAIPATDRGELEERLTAWLAGDEQQGVVSGRRLDRAPSKAVFVFPGQGGQWLGMGRSLFEREFVFRDAILRCEEAIRKQVGWSVVDELFAGADSSRLHEIDVVQPTLFAVMIALTELWRSLGVEPAAVVGHSMGEAAAAAVAGALSLDDAAAVICHRSRLMKRMRGQGLMAVVELSLDDTQPWLANAGRVWIAASNGATSTVVSGDTDAVEALLVALEAREIFCRRIQVDVASHSGHMDAVRDELEAILSHIQPRRGELPIYSTTTGEIEDGTQLDAAYWGKNLRQPVLFHPAVERLLADEFDTFVEVNAHPVLTHALTDSIQQSGHDAVVTGSLRRDTDEQLELLGGLGTLHAAGYPVDFQRLYPEGSCLRLPVYPWQRERHWFEPSGTPFWRSASSPQSTGLRAEQASGATLSDPAECLYEIAWTAAPTDDRAAMPEAGHWIVLADGNTGQQLVAELTALGDTCTLIRPGTSFEVSKTGEYTVNPASDEDLHTILASQIATCRGIIHAWSVSARDGEPGLNELWDAQSLGCFSAAALVRVLVKLNPQRPVRLWLVTDGVQHITIERETAVPAFPMHGALFGLGRAIAQEHPELPCTNLDLSRASQHDEIRETARLIRGDTSEQQMLVRGTQRFVARYQRVTATKHETPAIRPDGSYLITGGLGGLGLLTARWLVTRGARSLVLVGRKAPSADALRVIETLQAEGATVRVVAADVADADQVAQLLATIQMDASPVRGVLHLAATVDDALLANASEENYRRLLRPKMAGAWNLYRGLRGSDLDFWVSFSSIATVVNQPGQGSYAAANAFLDGLARYATARGERMQSLQWGPWAGTGLANEQGTQRSFQAYTAQGIQSMHPEFGVAILDRAVTQTAPVLLAAAIDWRTFDTASATDPGTLEFAPMVSLASSVSSTSASAPAIPDAADAAVPDLRDQLATVALGRPRTALIEQHLREQLATVLKTSPNRVDLQKPMGSMGVDSLMALELVRRLSRSIGVKIPATAVFNYPTITKLAAAVEVRIERQSGTPAQATTASLTAPALGEADAPSSVDVHAMSDEDALRALTGAPGVAQ
jgi:acyl transferase domain-containing protein